MKGGLGGLIKQAQVMKLKVEQAQAKLADCTYSAQAGDEAAGGVVKVTVSGRQQVKALSIAPGLAADPTLLEDLLLTALNQALDESHSAHEREMGSLTGGLNLPFGM